MKHSYPICEAIRFEIKKQLELSESSRKCGGTYYTHLYAVGLLTDLLPRIECMEKEHVYNRGEWVHPVTGLPRIEYEPVYKCMMCRDRNDPGFKCNHC